MVLTFWKTTRVRCGFKQALAMWALAAGFLGGCAIPPVQECGRAELAYVGLEGNQLRALRLDACSGKLSAIGTVAELPKPRWTLVNPQLSMLYAASDRGARDGSVMAFAVDRESGALTKVNEVAVGGAGTTHLWLDLPSMTLLAANFGGGSTASLPVNWDGSLGALVSSVKSVGTGPHRRQASPHAHGVAIDPSGRYALVADLGADRIFVYGFDRTSHALSPDDAARPRSFVVAPGSGPHRVVFAPNGRFVYLLNELTADVTTLRWDAQQGRLTQVQSLAISSPQFQGVKSGSELAVSADGRFVYVGDRGENTLVVYRVNPESGELTLIQRTPSGGDKPWTFAVHASGKWMLVANQGSNKVSLFRIDLATGLLADTGQSVDAPVPLSVTFMN